MRLLALIDLDHTLFQTEEFWEAVTELMGRKFPAKVTAQQLREERLDRRPEGPGRTAAGEGYDFFVHIGTHGIDPDEAEAAILAEFGGRPVDLARHSGGRWLNPGALDLLKYLSDHHYHMVVKTTGARRFQMLKYRCTGLPASIQIEALEGNKGADEAARWDAAGGFTYDGKHFDAVAFIDDSGATFKAVGERHGLLAFHVQGSPKHPGPGPEWATPVNTLDQIPAMLEAKFR